MGSFWWVIVNPDTTVMAGTVYGIWYTDVYGILIYIYI